MHGIRRGLIALVLLLDGTRDLAQGVGEQIIAALEHYRVAVVQMDYEDEIAAFTEDAEISQGDDAPVRGRAQIRMLIESQAAFKVVGYELNTAATRVEGTLAIQNGVYSQRIISPRHESVLSRGVFEVQWKRQSNGIWLISRIRTEPVENPPRRP